MNINMKKIIKKLYSIPLIWRFIGSFFRNKGVIVLMYHRIDDGNGFFPGFKVCKFNEQMRWIKNNCNVIHPDKFKESINNNKKQKPNVLITFDDGYRCCYQYAYPVLKELSLPALVFLATQPLDKGGLLWTDALYYLIHSTKENKLVLPWSGIVLTLDGKSSKNKAISEMKSYLKICSNDDRINYIVKLKKILKVTDEENISRQMLSWDEVRDSLNVVCYGGHTHTHPIMSKISESDLDKEIKTCTDRILDETGIQPKSFAYPNGRTTDYDSRCIKILNKYGYGLAYTTNEGLNDFDTDLMEIKRIPTNAKNLEDFVWLISTAG